MRSKIFGLVKVVEPFMHKVLSIRNLSDINKKYPSLKEAVAEFQLVRDRENLLKELKIENFSIDPHKELERIIKDKIDPSMIEKIRSHSKFDINKTFPHVRIKNKDFLALSPFMYAVLNGSKDIALYLLGHGANPRIMSIGKSILQLAFENPVDISIIKILVKQAYHIESGEDKNMQELLVKVFHEDPEGSDKIKVLLGMPGMGRVIRGMLPYLVEHKEDKFFSLIMNDRIADKLELGQPIARQPKNPSLIRFTALYGTSSMIETIKKIVTDEEYKIHSFGISREIISVDKGGISSAMMLYKKPVGPFTEAVANSLKSRTPGSEI